jgi:capsular exopolysaccharide synthesis family protein
VKKELIAHKDPKSPVSEIFRTLRTNIQFMNTNKQLKTLLVTSTMPGEGKSWISSNLAVAFAQAGKRVVLIDADMRKGRVYNIFGVLPRPGLSNYLSGVNESNKESGNIANYLRETEVPNLYVMPAGNIPPNPSELLITPQMANLLEELKRECDLIVIDATPSKLVTDAVILSRIVDSTLIVTAHNQTKKDDLEKIVKDIKNVGGNIAGVVYNKMPVSAKKYNETYYYASKQHSEPIMSKAEKEIDKVSEDFSSNEQTITPEEHLEEKTEENIEMPIQKNIEKSTEEPIEEIELPKSLRKDNAFENEKKVEKTPQEKTEEVLREFNEYLKREKKMKYKK